MYKICKTEKSIERQKLFQTTLLSMMKKQNYREITVTSLCKEMNAPRKAFYRYYDTLDDVLFIIIDEALTEAFLNLEVKADISGFFHYWEKRKSLLDIFEKNGISHLLMERCISKMLGDKFLDKPTDKDMKYTGYISAMLTMLVTWHHSGMHRTPEEMDTLVREMFRTNE